MVLSHHTFCIKKESSNITNFALGNIRNHLASAIDNNVLGERLSLKDALKMCDILRESYTSPILLITDHDEKYVADIIQLINRQLIRNPTLLLFLQTLNASVDSCQKLSEEDIAIILKNSALLASFEELFSFAEILNVVQNKNDMRFSVKRLYKFLKKIELDEKRTPLELWERKDSLRRLYAFMEFQATTLSDKIKCVKEYTCIQKNIHEIIQAIKITDEYVSALKMMEPIGGYSQKKLYQLYEDAFSGEEGRLTIRAYAQSIEKNVHRCC